MAGRFVVPRTYDLLMHGNGPDSGFDSPVSHSHERQQVINESWPYVDAAGQRHAVGIDDRPADEQVDVVVRLVFDVDGETYLRGRAIRWTRDLSHACITVNDPRVTTGMVWVRAHDARPATLDALR